MASLGIELVSRNVNRTWGPTFRPHGRLADQAARSTALTVRTDRQAFRLWAMPARKDAVFIFRDRAPAEVTVFHFATWNVKSKG